MPDVDPDALPELRQSTSVVVGQARRGQLSVEEIGQIGELLTVTADSFGEVQGKPWFKKAWALVSGERGRLTDRTLENLMAVQVGALRVLGDLLEDSGAMKDDLLMVFRRLNKLDSDNLELKRTILAFNVKYGERFQHLAKEARFARRARAIGFGITGLAFIVGGVLAFVPDLRAYWPLGVTVWVIAGVVLAGLATKEARRPPFRVATSKGTPQASTRPEEIAPHAARFLQLGTSLPEAERLDPRVFRVGGPVDELVGYFTLDAEEQRLLFSLQYHVARREASRGDGRRAKLGWLNRWVALLNESLDRPVVTDRAEFARGLGELGGSDLALPKAGTLLLEAATFKPYFDLNDGTDTGDLAIDPGVQRSEVRDLAPQFGVARAQVDEVLHAHEEALAGIPPSKFWKTVAATVATGALFALTGGLAAPAIATLVGGFMGLSGAAAVSAGLAFLGGGAIAAGGFGMAGGVAVLVGGGSIIGAGAGAGAVRLLGTDHALVLDQLAKLEAVSEVFLTRLPDGDRCVDAVVREIESTRREVEREIDRIEQQEEFVEEEWERRDELKKGLPYYRRAVERIEEVARRAA